MSTPTEHHSDTTESKYSNSRRRRTQLDSVCASKDQNLILGGLLGSGRCDSEVVHRRNLPSTPMSTSVVPRHSDHRSHLHCGAFRHVERHTLPIPRDGAICRKRMPIPVGLPAELHTRIGRLLPTYPSQGSPQIEWSACHNDRRKSEGDEGLPRPPGLLIDARVEAA